jgi:FixJ family two-component response regulator/DNA-binding MarR family transcriptional regulator
MGAGEQEGTVSLSNLDKCIVIVVDDDPECLDEYVEMIGALGYVCEGFGEAAEALRAIAANPRIGIVVTDVQMPAIDGLTLLDELASRFMAERPLVTLVITGDPSLENAIQAMRSNAIDFLPKPVAMTDLSAALRRASKRWVQIVGQMRLRSLTRLAKEREPVRPAVQPNGTLAQATPAQLQAVVRSIMRSRRKRLEFLDPTLFSDPAWDILLDLTSAALDGKPVPASSACAASQAPLSTALRHVRQLVAAGLVRRWQDPLDKRRTLLELEPEAFASMKAYLVAIWNRQGA